jgi:hypothetical protein
VQLTQRQRLGCPEFGEDPRQAAMGRKAWNWADFRKIPRRSQIGQPSPFELKLKMGHREIPFKFSQGLEFKNQGILIFSNWDKFK